MPNPLKTRMTARIPLALAEKVDQMAKRRKCSPDLIVNQALSSWLALEEERDRLTREALGGVEAGHYLPHSAIQAWANSLSSDEPLPFPKP